MNKRILVITRNSWNNSISTGNTASNFFEGWAKDSVANIFCRREIPDNTICDNYFRISENELIKSMKNKNEVGLHSNYDALRNVSDTKEKKKLDTEKEKYNFFRNNRWTIFLWLRELIWKSGNWKNKKLYDFLVEFNPEIIYMPVYNCIYMHDILFFVKRITGAKIILFTGDDMYSLKQFSISPLFWINRLIIRNKIRKTFNISDLCYSLSETQVKELKSEFGDKFKIMRKGVRQKNNQISEHKKNDDILELVYTGNIYSGRWKTLVYLANIIHEINKEEIKVRLYIYSANNLSQKIKKKLVFENEVLFMGAVSPQEVLNIQKKADVVIHAESFDLQYKYQTRLSFSTKLVDYFQNEKCILAIGWNKANSILYLKHNDAAIVVTKLSDLRNELLELIYNRDKILEYEKKSRDCGIRNHNLKNIQNEIKDDILNLLKD